MPNQPTKQMVAGFVFSQSDTDSEKITTSKVEVPFETYPNKESMMDTLELFPLVEASKLSLEDDFLRHKPQTNNQNHFKETIVSTVKAGLYDFCAQALDPSIDNTEQIFFRPGSIPGIGKSANWWKENIPKHLPGHRLGFKFERVAFLATLIKRGLVTWEQVCDHSEEIAYYWDPTKRDYEKTGSWPVGEFCDLANTYKIMQNNPPEELFFSLGGGNCITDGHHFPLAKKWDFLNPITTCYYGVGWIVRPMVRNNRI